MMHAWYSRSAAEIYGSTIYLSEDGKEVEVTCCAEKLEYGETYLWHDKIYVGRVKNFLMAGQNRSLEQAIEDSYFEDIQDQLFLDQK